MKNQKIWFKHKELGFQTIILLYYFRQWTWIYYNVRFYEKTFKGRCGKTNLSKHLQQHGKETDLFEERCDTCDRIFTSKWELEVHKFKHEERYECDVCNKTFASPICLARHKEDVHRSLKKFKCYICDSAFKSSIQMAQHIKIVHNRIKKYECEVHTFLSFLFFIKTTLL